MMYTVLFVAVFAIANFGSLKASPIAEQQEKLLNSLIQQASQYQGLSDPSLLADNADAYLTVPELIVKYGYPVEIHNITTADGYILEVHRMPYGKKCGPAAGKRVIWLQHGLISDSSNWVVNGVDKGLAYNLADACYDVWMGNARGNTYSKRHILLDPNKDKEAFWTFSFHEMGVYDLPADIDYVLKETGTDGIYYVGHSMGTTQFFVCMSERPEYNAKIKLGNMLAPVSYTEHMRSPIALIAPFASDAEWLLSMLGLYEFLPSNAFTDFIGATLCNQNSPVQAVCSNVLFLICGYDVSQLDPDLLPTILGHTPAGGSTRSTVHLAQGINSLGFQQYDYGRVKNLEVYGQETPFDYDTTKITAPVALYWGPNDWLSQQQDLYRLAEELPNLQKVHRINHDKFNHLDFLWAIDAIPLVNKPIMDFMENF